MSDPPRVEVSKQNKLLQVCFGRSSFGPRTFAALPEQIGTIQASASTRVKVWFGSLTLVTRTVFCICIVLSLASVLHQDLAHSACLSAQLATKQLQLYRIFTAPFVHSGILHVAFNMVAFVPMGASLERQLGSVQYTYFLFLFMLLGDVVYILCVYATSWLLGSDLTACAVGLSGVIFALVVVDTHISGAQQRSIFGFFSLPAPYFPWALLILWQLLLPHVSFFGHLGGLLAGQLYVWGLLKHLVPSASTFQAAERMFPARLCAPLDSFISHAGSSRLPTSVSASDSGLLRHAASSLSRPTWFQPRSALQGWLPLPTAEPQPTSEAREEAHGKGHVLGGMEGASSTAAPQLAPHLAAAAAAEARATKGAGQPPQRPRETLARDRDKAKHAGPAQELKEGG